MNKFKQLAIIAMIFALSTVCLKCYSAERVLPFDLKQRYGKIVYHNNEITIKTFEEPPDDFESRRAWAYSVLKPFLTACPSKITIVYNMPDNLYSKQVISTNVYIKNFLNKNINKEQFLQSLKFEMIELNKQKSVKIYPSIAVDSIILNLNNIMVAGELKELADTYRLSKKYDEAINVYKQVFSLNQADYMSCFWIANLYKQKNDTTSAVYYYKKAIEINPEFTDADSELSKIVK